MDYRIIRSKRRTISLCITPEGALEVRCPQTMTVRQIEDFVKSKEGWIKKHQRPPVSQADRLTKEQLAALKKAAEKWFPERVAFFAPRLGVTYGNITLRSQHTRWGSCSGKGNLSFNCLLMLAPEAVRDYVVVHELCHRREMNHSKAFWQLVESAFPGAGDCRRWLKENGSRLIARLP